MSHFIDLVQQARRKQLSDPRSTAEAMQAQQAELATLTNLAAEAMTKAGYRASPAARERISNTLLGAAVDRHLAEDLRHGRLTAERSAPGFEVLAGVSVESDLRVRCVTTADNSSGCHNSSLNLCDSGSMRSS